MSVFIFAADGSHRSIKHKTFDLLCVAGAQLCQLIVSLFFRNISKHVDLRHKIFISGKMFNSIHLIET